MSLVTSEAGLKLIKSFESCRLTAYQDIKGIWTIGWGHTGPTVHSGMQITQSQADDLLSNDLQRFELCVNSCAFAEITQSEFDALVCFSYNVGDGALKHSTLLEDLNHHELDKAAKDFLDWDKANGHVVAGLLRRRRAESQLFLNELT